MHVGAMALRKARQASIVEVARADLTIFTKVLLSSGGSGPPPLPLSARCLLSFCTHDHQDTLSTHPPRPSPQPRPQATNICPQGDEQLPCLLASSSPFSIRSQPDPPHPPLTVSLPAKNTSLFLHLLRPQAAFITVSDQGGLGTCPAAEIQGNNHKGQALRISLRPAGVKGPGPVLSGLLSATTPPSLHPPLCPPGHSLAHRNAFALLSCSLSSLTRKDSMQQQRDGRKRGVFKMSVGSDGSPGKAAAAASPVPPLSPCWGWG